MPKQNLVDTFEKFGQQLRVREAEGAALLREQQERATRVAAKIAETARQAKASYVYEQLTALIKDFDAVLDQSQEVGIRLVSFGPELVFHVESLGFWDPNLIVFSGKKTDGSPVQLIQHATQLSFLLTVLPRPNPDEPKTPFGFATDHLGTSTECGAMPEQAGHGATIIG